MDVRRPGQLPPHHEGDLYVEWLGDETYLVFHDEGKDGGVPEGNTVGRVRMGKLALPRGAESLKPALDACLAKKPAKTTPPSHA